ncbi:MAG TPA: urease accessory protein UreE [Methylomirabilota bacterium]|nr:urease accessory protein UreE [Methylomirabilota bacterium]
MAGLEADVVELTAQERRRARRRVVTRAGRVFTLALPAGDVLVPGRVLHVGPGWYVTVEAAPEALLAITPRTPREGLRVALEVGRLHAALAVAGGRLLVPDEPAVERLLRRLGVPWVRAREPFLPVSSGSPH